MKKSASTVLLAIALLLPLLESCEQDKKSNVADRVVDHVVDRVESLGACEKMLHEGLRQIASHRADRFLGEVQRQTAECRAFASPER